MNFTHIPFRSHTGCRLHRDACDITWQMMLSRPCDYSGGGTYIQALHSTIKLKPGQVLVHPGSLLHKGVDITSGERNLLIGFMKGIDPKVVEKKRPFFKRKRSRNANVVRV